MKRRIFTLFFAILLLCQFPLHALASEEKAVIIRSGYWTDDVLYTFAHFPQEAPDQLEVRLFINNCQQGQQVHPRSFRDTGATAHYMLLIDTSSSMETYAHFIRSFVQSLLKTGTNLTVSIATMGSDFCVAATDLTSWDAVQPVLCQLDFQHDGSNICDGTAKALEFLGEKSYQAGDISNLIVITDGNAGYSNPSALECDGQDQSAEAVAAMMDTYPEITVNTLCFRGWDKNTFSVLSSGSGLHLSANTASDAEQMGQVFSDYMNSLYTVAFPLSGYSGTAVISDSIQLFVENCWFSLEKCRNLNMQPALAADGAITPPPVDGAEETPTQATEGTVPTETTQATEEPTTETPIPEVTAQESGAMDTESIPIPGKVGAYMSPWMIGVGIAIAAVILAVICILVKKKNAKASAVRIRVDILAGEAIRKKEIYFLRDSLLIGSGKQCDIVLLDPAAKSVNTRIFMQDQIIYIEDMDSPQGTVLNGMLIFSSNRLRSEDEITIGSTVLRVLF